MSPSNALIRRDLDQLPPIDRRLARDALQLFLSDTALHERLKDSDFTNALWQLTHCLLETAALGFFDAALVPPGAKLSARVRNALRSLAAELDDGDSDADDDDDEEEEEWTPPFLRAKHQRASRPRQRRLRLFYAGLTHDLVEPLGRRRR